MTPDIAAYLDEKMAAIEKLVNDSGAYCDVELGRAEGHAQQGNVWRAEITLLQKGEQMRVEAVGESINAAIDAVKDEMLRQLRKGKDKNTSLTRGLGARLKRWARRGDIRSY